MEAFFVNAWNALPQILLTALISGIGVYLFQKRVEAKNQKASIRFVRNHQKRLEALEDIYIKLNSFHKEFKKLLNNDKDADKDTLRSKLDILSESFLDNLIYFSADEHIYIYTVYRILPVIALMGMNDVSSKTTVEEVKFINKGLELIDLDLIPVDYENPDWGLYRTQLNVAVERLVMKIQDLHRTIAEIDKHN